MGYADVTGVTFALINAVDPVWSVIIAFSICQAQQAFELHGHRNGIKSLPMCSVLHMQ